MKICPVGAEFFHADGRRDRDTDTTKLVVAFRNFANGPKNDIYKRISVSKCEENGLLGWNDNIKKDVMKIRDDDDGN